MVRVKLTFFHDVICPYCYVTNRRLKEALKGMDGKVEVVHKAFGIISDLEDLKSIAPTEEEAREFFKKEMGILKDYIPGYDPERVIGKGKIKWVWSTPPLTACKAAEKLEGQRGHEKIFDLLQDMFFIEGEDITNEETLANAAVKIGLDREKFLEKFRSKEARYAVILDEDDAHALGIRGVPAILINDTWLLRGVPEVGRIREVVEDVATNGEPKKTMVKAFWESR